jgi:hypothetical protein
MLRIGELTTEECVCALRTFGFVETKRDDDRVVLERGTKVVVIPADAQLAPTNVRFVARLAGLHYDDLLGALALTRTG